MTKTLIAGIIFVVCGSAQSVIWKKAWTAPNTGTFGTYFNGYHDIHYDPYTQKTWIYSTDTSNTGDGIYSTRLHYFDTATNENTVLGDNGQPTASSAGCFSTEASPNVWPGSRHVVGQFVVDTVRHLLVAMQGTACADVFADQFAYSLETLTWAERLSPHAPITNTQNNNRISTLAAAITATDTTLSITAPAGFGNNEYDKIDSEIVKVISGGGSHGYVSGNGVAGSNPFVVLRGQLGTVQASHAAGATIYQQEGQFNNASIVYDSDDDVFFMLGLPQSHADEFWVYCDTTQNPQAGVLTANQTKVGCTRADDWSSISSKSICADSHCKAIVTGTNGINSGKVPPGTYYPNLEYDAVHHEIIQWAGSYGASQPQNLTFAYSPSTFTWTNLAPVCLGADCVNGAPLPQSSNSENYRMAHAEVNGQYYYHLARRPTATTGNSQDWVLDPVADTWTELQSGSGPSYTETMTYDSVCNCLVAWGTSTSGQALAEMWVGALSDSSSMPAATAPVIGTPSPLPGGTQGQPYSQLFTATGTAPISWILSSGSLPPGLMLSSSGVLSGTPTAAGTYQFSISSVNSIGTSAPAGFGVTVGGLAPLITTVSPLMSGIQGQSYSQSLAATGTAPISWNLFSGALPPGLSLNSSTGVISGVSAEIGTFSFALTASNSVGTSSALTVSLSMASAPGLGHSTYNCVDVDGDGRGVGPGCIGPDADDADATVATYSDVIAKYGSLASFWTHMGWSPTAVYYVDGGTGSCTAVSSPFAYSSSSACKTVDAAVTAMSAGQAVVLRASATSTRSATIMVKPGTLNGSTCTNYSYYLTYPGEQAVFTFSGQTGMSESGTQSCIVVDGWALVQGSNHLGVGAGISNSSTVYGYTLSHLDVSGFTWNIFPQYHQMGTLIAHNYIHNAYQGGDFGHDIYLGSNVATSNGTTIIGNVIDDAVDTCIHLNGPMTNITVDSNLIYGCSKAINVQSGISRSTFQNNVVHSNAKYLFQINTYANEYSTHTWQCHDENYNVIRNNTFWEDGQSWNPTGTPGGTQSVSTEGGASAIYVVDDGSCQTQASYTPDLGHNVYDNNIIVHSCGPACSDYNGPLIRYTGANAATYLSTDAWHNNLLYNADESAHIIDPGPTANVTYQDCRWFAANVHGGGNICNINPELAAADGSWATSPDSWNLSPVSASAAMNAALSSDSPIYDALGILRSVSIPSIGAYEK